MTSTGCARVKDLVVGMAATLTLSLMGIVSHAQNANPYIDCQGDPAYRQFDFWLGEWQVHDAAGTFQGANSIRLQQRKCLISEDWRSATGGSGQSMNYYEPRTKKWRQLWVDSGASIIDISGGMDDESMVLVGTIYYLKQGTEHPFRGRWTPLEDGRVRQFFEQRDAQGNWQAWFEGFYSRNLSPDDGAGETGSSS